MKIGVRAHDYGRNTPDALFERISKDGFSTIQLAPKKAIAGVSRFEDISGRVEREVLEAEKRWKIRIAVLGVYLEPSLADDAAREKNVSEYLGSIPIAKRLGADCIGTETTARNKQPGTTREEALDALKRSLWKIMPAAEEQQVLFAIEPVCSHTVNTPECAAEILKSIASPNLKIIFDPVNLLSPEDFASQPRMWDRAFRNFGDQIVAVHMKSVRLSADGSPVRTDFAHSDVDYGDLFKRLRQLPQDFSVLREDADPADGKTDCEFLKSMI
jgi:L-ribulose-5-phosphate 3-epimerase